MTLKPLSMPTDLKKNIYNEDGNLLKKNVSNLCTKIIMLLINAHLTGLESQCWRSQVMFRNLLAKVDKRQYDEEYNSSRMKAMKEETAECH